MIGVLISDYTCNMYIEEYNRIDMHIYTSRAYMDVFQQRMLSEK